MRRVIGAVVVVALALWWLWPRGAGSAAVEGSAGRDPVGSAARDPVGSAAAGPGSAASGRGSGPKAAAAPRVRVPRREVARAAADPSPAAGAGPVDRRAGGGSEAVRELLMQELTAVTEDAAPCADRWAAMEPALNDRLMLRFALDADGLQDVWIEGHASAPDEVLSCFADAVWAPDWAGISEEPLEVTWPVEVRAEE